MSTNSISQDEQLKPRAHAPAGGPNLIASFKNGIIGQTTTSIGPFAKAMHGDEASADAAVTTLYHGNQQYSVTAISDSSGNVSERYAYTAYGQPTFLNASGTAQTSSAANNRYTYTGREWDSTRGLHHFRARWMNGITGRFLTRDPTGYNPGKSNLSEFLFCRPNSLVDPHGEHPVIIAYCGLAVYAVACSAIVAGFDSGTRLPNVQEGACLSNLGTLVPPGHYSGRPIRIDPNAGSPITKCHPGCVGSQRIYFAPQDVKCSNCSGALNTLLSILHECVHENSQRCSYGPTNCGELEATARSLQVITRDRISLCTKLVNFGYCGSVNQCQSDLTDLVNAETDVKAQFYKDCKKDRKGLNPDLSFLE